jgi:hypothetical protein
MVVDTRKQDSHRQDQSRLNAALNMAIEKLSKVGDSRLVSVDADLSAVEVGQARVPVIIRADMADGEAVADVQEKLADDVFGPIYGETRVSMPMIMLLPNESARTEMESPDGLLFPLFGR